MSRFNATKKAAPSKLRATRNTNRSRVVRNTAGGKAYSQTAELELASLILTSLFQDKAYVSMAAERERLKKLTGENPLFAAQAAVYARNQFGLRSISHAVAGEIGALIKGEDWTRPFFRSVVRRADDITEILAYYLALYGKPIPNSLKRGLADAFGKFDEYQLAKYKGDNSAISLVDAVNLLHPKPNERNARGLTLLVDGELKNTETWEAQLSAAGGDKAAKAQVWRNLISERKLGYMALLKNLRNIAEQASQDTVDLAIKQLVDEKAIQKSLVLPFRYVSAYDQLRHANSGNALVSAVSQACDIATVTNVPKFEGSTLVVVDSSGSMGSASDEKSPAGIASLFAGVVLKANPNADLMLFADNAQYVTVDTTSGVLGIRNQIAQKFYSGGTNFHAIFQHAKKKYDHIIVLSDMQGWVDGGAPDSSVLAYKAKYGAKPNIYSFDLTGHGTLQFPQEKVFCIAGFSDKVFTLLGLLQKDRNALVTEIKKTRFE